MGTVPTGKMERELRALYLRWLAGLSPDDNLTTKIDAFAASSQALISKLGGQAARLGALGDFPAPKLLELSPHVGTVYNAMHQAAIQAGMLTGLQSTDVARQMFNAGMDKSFRRLNRLARTETVSAYWKNSWDSVAELPLLVMVWGSESGPRTCDYCLSRDGLVVEDPNIRDHPNGRCTLIPTLRSQVKYKGTLQPDGSVDMDPRWSDQKVKGAKAQESAGPTTEAQRDPLSGKSNPAAPSTAQPAQSSAPRPSAAPQQTTEVKVIRTSSDPDIARASEYGIKGGDWRYIEDRQQRAVVMLQNDYRSEQAIKAVAKNISEGRDAFDKVKLTDKWFKSYEGRPKELRYTNGVHAYTASDVKDAVEDAAHWLLEQEAVKKRSLYKGLDISRADMKMFQEGGTFDVSYSSFTANESVAYRYTAPSNRVVVKVTNGNGVELKDKDNVSSFGGNSAAHQEYLMSGQGTITKIESTGGVTWIHVKL